MHGSKNSPKSVVETTVTTDQNGQVTGKKTIERSYRYDDDAKPIDVLTVMMISAVGGALVALAAIRLASLML